MAKENVNQWSATASANTDVGGINIDEACAPSNINNALREVMSQVADMVGGTTALSAINIDGGTVTGITDLAVVDGGTGASDASGARANLGLGTSAILYAGTAAYHVVQLDGSAKIPAVDGSQITNLTIADDAVTGPKIAMGSDAQGDLLYRGASNYQRLVKGTASQVLQMNSGATAPEWGAGTSAYRTLLQTITLSSDTSFDVGDPASGAYISNTYREYQLDLDDISVSVDLAMPTITFLTGTTPTEQTSTYHQHTQAWTSHSGGVAGSFGSTSATHITWSGNGSNVAGETMNGHMNLLYPGASDRYTALSSNFSGRIGQGTDTPFYQWYGGGSWLGGFDAITGLRFKLTYSGAYASGTIRLYGLS